MTNTEPKYGIKFMQGFMVAGAACAVFWAAAGVTLASVLVR